MSDPRADESQPNAGPPAGEPEAGGRLGRYALGEQLGEGGMGVVFAAFDPELERDVAIKVLRPGRGRIRTAEGRARLIREAQAMARLSHPNVVPVFDVGVDDGHVFVAMERVYGATLDVWLMENTRTQSAIIDVLVEAAMGLRAAHAAGFVHRDFKPSNVMVTEKGRAVVMDFGLARAVDGDGSVEGAGTRTAADDEAAESSGSVSRLASVASASSRLTEAGTVMGTPVYMAPEQHRGRAPDARADQFAFCVTAWEALRGSRPFAGTTTAQLAANKAKDGPRDRGRPISTRLDRVLRRGLAVKPEDRYGTMDELIDALRRAQSGPRRARWIGGGLVVAGVAATLGAALSGGDDPCAAAEARLSGSYDDAKRDAVRAAFLKTGVPYAGDVWQSTDKRLTRYATVLVEDSVATCRAGRQAGSNGSLADRRAMCLGRAEAAFNDRVERFVAADEAVVQHAVGMVSSLPLLDRCLDEEALSAEVAPPADAQTEARVQSLRAELDSWVGEANAGRWQAARKGIAVLVEEARTLDYAPALAEVLLWQGTVLSRLGERADAEAAWKESASLAEGAGASYLAAWAAIRMVQSLARDTTDDEAIEAWVRHAEVWLQRGPPDPLLRAQLDNALGIYHNRRERSEKAYGMYSRAYEAKREVLGEDDLETVRELANVAIATAELGRLDEASEIFDRVADRLQATLGPQHPDTGRSIGNLGGVLSLRGQHAEAAAAYERALNIFEANFGPEHPGVAGYHDSLGAELLGMGRFDEAREHHQRALELLEKAHGSEHPEVAWAWGNLGLAAYRMREYDEALRCFDRLLAIAEPLFGEGHPAIELTYVNKALARVSAGQLQEAEAALEQASAVVSAIPDSAELRSLTHYARGRLAVARLDHGRARAEFRKALEVTESAGGAEHPDLVEALVALAEASLADGDVESAAEASTRALRILEATPLAPSVAGQTQFVAARVHAAAGRAEQARRSAEIAQQNYAEAGPRFASERDAVRRWLTEQHG